jgi:hypothetical protein
MRSMLGICGAIAATVCLAPGVQANDHRPLLTLSAVHSNIIAANSAQEAVGQSEPSTTTAKPEKAHVTTQRVVESTTTVKPPKPEKQHVTTQHVVESTTTVKPPKPEKVHVTKQRVVESTTTAEAP